MNPSRNVHCIDLFEAVKYDVRLHGSRFIILEFAAVGVGALVLAIVEFLHAGNGVLPLLGGIWFLCFALNCLAVAMLGVQVRRTGTATTYSDRRLHLYAAQLIVLLLVPLAVAAAAVIQWRRGDSGHG